MKVSATIGSSSRMSGAIGRPGTGGSGNTTWSATQRDSKPAASAARPRRAAASGWAQVCRLTECRPNFIGAPPDRVSYARIPNRSSASDAHAGHRGRMREIGFGQSPSRGTHDMPIRFRRRAERHVDDRVIAVGRHDGARLSTEALRRFTGLHGANAPTDLLSEHDDPAIGGPQMLEGMDGDRPLADLRFVVSRTALTGLVRVGGRQLTGEHDAAVGPPGWRH